MVVVNRKNNRPFFQERLSADDIALLLTMIKNDAIPQGVTETRIELLTAKLARMEKQK